MAADSIINQFLINFCLLVLDLPVLDHQTSQLEPVLQHRPHVILTEQLLQHRRHEQELLVLLASEACDRDPVAQVPRKRHDRVVNDDDVAQVSVFDDSQVFDEDVGSWLDAVLSVKAVFNNAVFVVD